MATIIESRTEEIIQPLLDAIENYDESLDAGIIITGNASKMKFLKDFIVEKTGLEVHIGDHSEWLSDKTDKKYSDTSFSQLIGTIVLNHEHRLAHPIEVLTTKKKKTKLPKRNVRAYLDGLIGDFFGEDDNHMDQKTNQKEVKTPNSEK